MSNDKIQAQEELRVHKSMSSSLHSRYLLFYNSFQALGWVVALFCVLSNFISTKYFSGAYGSAGELICFLQSLAFLEVIHGAMGIVPTGVLMPLLQWAGRIYILLSFLRIIHEVQESLSVFIMFLAWSFAEVIRYSHHAFGCTGNLPFWITYLRYTAFIVLYPIGVGPGEMWLMYQSLPFIKEKNLYEKLFSGPISYHTFVKAFLIFYPFAWLPLYLHMFKQRSSKLGKEKKKKN